MATIGNLAVILTAHTGAFDKRLYSSGSSVITFAGRIESLQGSMKRLYALAAGLAAGAVAHLITKNLEFADSAGKLSDRLNMPTEDLQRLRYAAQLSGSSIEEMDGDLEKMSRKLYEAANGGGTASGALKHLGLDAKDLVTKNLGDSFKDIAASISQVQNQSERASLEFQIFGRTGQKLDNLLMRGKEGLKEWGDEADKAGYSFSRIDAAWAEKAVESIKRLELLWKGFTLHLAIELAPIIEAVGRKLFEMGTNGEGAARSIIGCARGIAVAWAKVMDVFHYLGMAFDVLVMGAGTLIQLLLTGAYGIIVAFTKVVEGLQWGANAIADSWLSQKMGLNTVDWTSGLEKASTALDKWIVENGQKMKKMGEDLTNNWIWGQTNESKVKKWFDELDAETARLKTKYQHLGEDKQFDLQGSKGKKAEGRFLDMPAVWKELQTNIIKGDDDKQQRMLVAMEKVAENTQRMLDGELEVGG